jgi:D-lactate dehydrogenase
MPSIEKDLLGILVPDQIKTSLLDRLSYASDAGFYELIPQAVVLPGQESDIQALLSYCSTHAMPLVFRAGGTSLSGQSITDGLLADISRWRGMRYDERTGLVTVQPGITGGMVNARLKKYGVKIGPDPASIHAAMMGGILSNNSSGMCCGVAHNSYHTLSSIRFVLANGNTFNTASPADYDRFLREEKSLSAVVADIRGQLLADERLCEKIRSKYRYKNTIGYSLNAFLDFTHPLDIFSRLLIGAEGTLAFIAEATLITLPDKACKTAAMLYFKSIDDACMAIARLKETGVEALELMDRAALQSVEHLEGLPSFFRELPAGTSALLCEYQAQTASELSRLVEMAKPVIDSLSLLQPAVFTTTEKERTFYWKIRKGMFPSVGAVRKKGTTVILEDVVFPVEHLAAGVADLRHMFADFGYDHAIIFGHAKDGNLHFVLTQLFNTKEEIHRYDQFMQQLAKMVVGKHNGSLKGEHGTGRNMAPFVEAEWGGAAFAFMKRLKNAADPQNLLNPGVIVNDSKTAHIQNLKPLPEVEEEVDKCIECGYCETSCPSRDYTMTPRRRIVARRALQRLMQSGDKKQAAILQRQYVYDGLQTCATDGLCASECPVDINTGELVKRLRRESHSGFANRLAMAVSKNFAATESAARASIGLLAWLDGLFRFRIISRASTWLHDRVPSIPVWMHGVVAARKISDHKTSNPDYIYFSSCINRVMDHRGNERSLQTVLLTLCEKAGISLQLSRSQQGLCCGQPFSSKGFHTASLHSLQKLTDWLWQETKQGAVPVVCDFSSCTYTLIQQSKLLPAAYRDRWSKMVLLDSVFFLENKVAPKLPITPMPNHAVLHPACSVQKMHLTESFRNLAERCSSRVLVPHSAGCCGMAGDRGFLVPGLVQSATLEEAAEATENELENGYSSACTCEMALSQATGKPYWHIAYLLALASKA